MLSSASSSGSARRRSSRRTRSTARRWTSVRIQVLAFARSAENAGGGAPDGRGTPPARRPRRAGRRAAPGRRGRRRPGRRGRRARPARPRRRARRARRGPRRRGERGACASSPADRAGATLARVSAAASIAPGSPRAVDPVRFRVVRTGPRLPPNTPRHTDHQGDKETGNEQTSRARGAAIAVVLAAVAAVIRASARSAASASSHREAPLIAEDPSADLTDVYAFRSPDKPDTVTLLANVHAGRGSGGRPELVHVLADRAVQPQDRHERRRQARRHLPVPVPDARRGRTSSATPRSRSRSRGSRVARRRSSRGARRRRTTSGRGRLRDYDSLATKSIVSFAGGGEAFAGQRDDPFFGDVGAIFDLVAIRKGTGNAGGGKDFFAGYGVHTYADPGADRRPDTRRTARSACGPRSSARRSTMRGADDPGLGQLGPGRPAREPARQRGDHPDRAEGPLEPLPAVERVAVRAVLHEPILAAVINKLYKLGAPETGP